MKNILELERNVACNIYLMKYEKWMYKKLVLQLLKNNMSLKEVKIFARFW